MGYFWGVCEGRKPCLFVRQMDWYLKNTEDWRTFDKGNCPARGNKQASRFPLFYCISFIKIFLDLNLKVSVIQTYCKQWLAEPSQLPKGRMQLLPRDSCPAGPAQHRSAGWGHMRHPFLLRAAHGDRLGSAAHPSSTSHCAANTNTSWGWTWLGNPAPPASTPQLQHKSPLTTTSRFSAWSEWMSISSGEQMLGVRLHHASLAWGQRTAPDRRDPQSADYHKSLMCTNSHAMSRS